MLASELRVLIDMKFHIVSEVVILISKYFRGLGIFCLPKIN
jgi:hypothetical protein